MYIAALVAAGIVNLVALGAGVWLGTWVAKRVPLTLDLPNANPAGVRITMWMMRVFIFLICFVSVSAPVTFLTEALLNA